MIQMQNGYIIKYMIFIIFLKKKLKIETIIFLIRAENDRLIKFLFDDFSNFKEKIHKFREF